MTRLNSLFAAAVVAAIVAITPAAQAQTQACKGGGGAGCTVHVVGAGSSAQLNPAAIGADVLANTKLGGFYATATQCVYHFSAKNAANLVDNRGTVAIPLEPANVWAVWIADKDGGATGTMSSYSITSNVATIVGTGFNYIVGDSITTTDASALFPGPYVLTAATSTSLSFAYVAGNVGSTPDAGSVTDTTSHPCPSTGGASMSLGNQNITDVWMDASVDSTVGVRAFLAQNTSANGGAGVAVQFIAVAAGNLLGTGAHNIWPDNAADVSVLTGGATNLPLTIGTNQNGLSDVHVNMGMTDITPADAYFATTRSLTKLNTSTYAGLGYNSTTNVGNSILTSEGTGTKATPVKFALFDNDPITAQPIRGYKSVPIGAAPIVFVYNNNGDSTLHDILTGVIGDGTSSGSFPLAKLFDGDTSCDTSNAAFNPPDLGAKPMHLFLREPLSGTMNTTEFNLFRTVGQTSNTQEKHVDPSVDNPLTAKPCGTGDRNRAIGTGEVIGKAGSAGVLGVAHGFGYIFSSFANLQKFGGASPAANYNYLTLDGVDPFGFNTGVVPQYTFPNCSGPCAESTYWTGVSYPNIRNGSYKAYSVYRWVIDSTDVDAYGPTVLAQSTQDHINDSTGVADFIPFTQTGNADGLPVYRSHFLVSGTYKTTGTAQETFNYCNVASGNADCNGTATSASVSEGGNTLGTGEAGGDVGGLVEGPFHTGYTSGYVTTTSTCTSGKGFKVTRKTNVGDAFIAGASWENQNITIGGVTYQVSPIALTATVLYVGGTACGLPTPPTNTTGLYYYIGVGGTGLAAPNGIISKKE